MRNFLLFIAFCCYINASAQRVDKPGEPYDVYCSLRFVDGSRCIIGIAENKQMYIVNENNEAFRFETPAAILTYMSKRGWTFVSYIESLYWPLGLVMKKTVNSDKQALDNINVSDNPQKKQKRES